MNGDIQESKEKRTAGYTGDYEDITGIFVYRRWYFLFSSSSSIVPEI